MQAACAWFLSTNAYISCSQNVRKRSPLLMHLTMLDSNLKMLLRARIQFSGNRSMNLCSMCLVAVNKRI